MKYLLLSTLCFCQFISYAQKIAVPKLSDNDPELHRAMPAIAKQLIVYYKETNKQVYWDNMLRYQLVAKEYQSSVASLDSLQKIFAQDTWEGNPAIGIQFRTYALAKAAAEQNGRALESIFYDTLSAVYGRLPETARPFIDRFFGADSAALRKNISGQIEKLQESDSISVEEAAALVRSYNSWNVITHTLSAAKKFLAAEDEKKYIIEEQVLLPGDKNALLSAVIVRNKINQRPAPVIIMYNIYAGPGDKTIAKTAASKGYTGVVINTRGKQNSPDSTAPFEHDAADIYAALEWTSKQAWCNGKAAMYGGSYLGFSQWSAVKKLHPVLKTIVPQVAVGAGIDFPMHNGIFMNYMLPWIHYVTNNKTTDLPEFSDKAKWDSVNMKWYLSGKPFRSLDSIEGRRNTIFRRWLQHPSYDRFWQKMVPFEKEFAQINIPILTTTGYFDDDQRGAFYYYNQHHKWNKNARHYLLIGPWDHAGAQSAAAENVMGYTIDSVANININETVWQWFDHILKDSARPALLKDKVNYQVMGTNQWRSAPDIQSVSNDSLVFYLSDVYTKNGYKLEPQLPAEKKYITEEVSYLERSDKKPKEFAILDAAIETADRLVFAGAPLEKDLVFTGALEGELKVIINKKDIDLNIELYALQPDGKYFLLSYTLQRASFIKDPQQRTLLQPGKEITIPVYNSFFTSKKIEKGSRFILVAGINKSPYWQMNYGTGKDVSDETINDGKVPLRIQWSNRSFIKLPLSR